MSDFHELTKLAPEPPVSSLLGTNSSYVPIGPIIMDGFVLCHTWMQDADLRAIPFIFYSANLTLAEDAHVGKELGAARYLIKPMEQEEFLRELRKVLLQWGGDSRPRT